MSNHFAEDQSSIVQNIVAQKAYKKKKENVLLQMEILVCRLCLPVLIESNKRLAHMKYMSVSIIMDEKKQQRQQQETRLNEQTCVYAPCQMDIN